MPRPRPAPVPIPPEEVRILMLQMGITRPQLNQIIGGRRGPHRTRILRAIQRGLPLVQAQRPKPDWTL